MSVTPASKALPSSCQREPGRTPVLSDSTRLSDPELRVHELVDGLRARLACGRFHHLPHEPSGKGWFGLRLLGFVRIGGDDGIDHPFDCAQILDLGESMRLEHNPRIN